MRTVFRLIGWSVAACLGVTITNAILIPSTTTILSAIICLVSFIAVYLNGRMAFDSYDSLELMMKQRGVMTYPEMKLKHDAAIIEADKQMQNLKQTLDGLDK